MKAHKKFDTLGVGLKEQAARMQDWTLDMCKFSAVLKGLQEISAPEGESEEQQPSKPENAARSRKQKKRAREGEGADAPAEQVACPGKEASQLQTAKHAKMYSWRKQQKMVKGYSATDIAAILGHAPGTFTFVSLYDAAVLRSEVQVSRWSHRSDFAVQQMYLQSLLLHPHNKPQSRRTKVQQRRRRKRREWRGLRSVLWLPLHNRMHHLLLIDQHQPLHHRHRCK